MTDGRREDDEHASRAPSSGPRRTPAFLSGTTRMRRRPGPDGAVTPVLDTGRLVLRQLTMDDLDDLAALYRDPEARRWFPEGVLTREETRAELAWVIDVYYRQYGYGLWAAVLKENGAFVGRCGLLPWEIGGRTEVEAAYLADPAHWGRGAVIEAARGSWRTPSRRCRSTG